MALGRTGNPTLSEKVFTEEGSFSRSEAMTIQGTVHKTGFLVLIAAATSIYTWRLAYNPLGPQAALPWIWAGLIAGFVLALIICFAHKSAPFLAPVYAVAEGLLLGGISAFYEMQFKGIVVQALGLTLATLISLLLAYTSGVIKATENFKLGVVAATGAVFLVYLAGFVLSFFGIAIPKIHESGPIGIAFSAVVVVIAALNLVLDFDFIEKGAEKGAPKYMEWYAAFGLLVTLIWLYLEILRLLSKARRK